MRDRHESPSIQVSPNGLDRSDSPLYERDSPQGSERLRPLRSIEAGAGANGGLCRLAALGDLHRDSPIAHPQVASARCLNREFVGFQFHALFSEGRSRDRSDDDEGSFLPGVACLCAE